MYVVYDMENLETWMWMLKIFDLFSKWQKHILVFFKKNYGWFVMQQIGKLNAKVQNIWFVWQMENENLGWFFYKNFKVWNVCDVAYLKSWMQNVNKMKFMVFWVLLFYKLESMSVHTMMTFSAA
jgi:hypothetical protein